jgi:hypothetical protein
VGPTLFPPMVEDVVPEDRGSCPIRTGRTPAKKQNTKDVRAADRFSITAADAFCSQKERQSPLLIIAKSAQWIDTTSAS